MWRKISLLPLKKFFLQFETLELVAKFELNFKCGSFLTNEKEDKTFLLNRACFQELFNYHPNQTFVTQSMKA